MPVCLVLLVDNLKMWQREIWLDWRVYCPLFVKSYDNMSNMSYDQMYQTYQHLLRLKNLRISAFLCFWRFRGPEIPKYCPNLKFGTTERMYGLICHTKFHYNKWNVGLSPPWAEKYNNRYLNNLRKIAFWKLSLNHAAGRGRSKIILHEAQL